MKKPLKSAINIKNQYLKDFTFESLEDGFLGVPAEYIKNGYLKNLDDAKVVVVPFGLEKSVSYGGGTKNGPRAIIKASPQLELFDEEFWCEPFLQYGILTMKAPKINPSSVAKSLEQLEKITAKILQAGKFPLILGGEHSITAGSIRPFVKKYPNLAILHFDAHADLRDGYDGEHFSHASALRRVMDNPISTLISCGIRNISASEIPYLEANSKRIKIHFAKDKKNWDPEKIVAPLKGREVFVTFDIDGFDSGIMQATGTPEPGGMQWDDALEIIRQASKICKFVGADVVELAPVKYLHSCDFLSAKLCYKILSYAFCQPKK
ncbi:agmatinase [Alphaproteobacteria bacterium]|nr:agmatinase [Alphaproteobacteria bacterium]